MKITNVKVYGLDETITASGLPKSNDGEAESSIERATRLGNVPHGSGHDCFLKGIIVQYDLTADHSFWMQFQRYHFHDIISSQSKMHCITSMDKQFHPLVTETTKYYIEYLLSIYNDETINYPYRLQENNQIKIIFDKKEMFECIIMNCPIGLELKARITDNYLQLKTKLNQREYHKMGSWKEYCDWIKTLPKFVELVLSKNKNKSKEIAKQINKMSDQELQEMFCQLDIGTFTKIFEVTKNMTRSFEDRQTNNVEGKIRYEF